MSDHAPLVIDMVVVMIRIGLILEMKTSIAIAPVSEVIGDQEEGKHTAVEERLARHKDLSSADQRGAVAFEMLIVWLFLMMSLLLPLADVAAAGFQFISAWGALRELRAIYPVRPAT